MSAHQTGLRLFAMIACVGLATTLVHSGWARGASSAGQAPPGAQASHELKPEVTVDVTKTRAPMSKYIYGQFIEHLGRCIYGGIWAEMLEDRKFYYTVGSKESPWKPIGDPASVTMNKAKPFVGVHTPDVRLTGGAPGGIVQGDLGVVAGRRYTGRIVLAGDPAVAPVRVTLAWGDGPSERESVIVTSLDPEFKTLPFMLTSEKTSDTARLEVTSEGRGLLRIGTISLMPADNVRGFRADTLQLLRELNSPVYRWPGGNFVSGYDWRDGIGDPDKRPPRKNPAWQGVEHNDVGIHEFMALCELIGAEPYVSVNSGLGDETSAADEVEYINGEPTTPMGGLRARNGHEKPFGCRFFSVGNEMYGDWQLGHMPLADYVKKHRRFAEAMRAKDPAIQLVAVGTIGQWDELMLKANADRMNLISEHFYVGEKADLLSHVSQVPREVRRIAEAHRGYRKTIPELDGKDIRIALDEWNYWYGPHLYGELGTRYFLKDALGIAEGLHEYSRQSDIIYMANYAQTVNVIGAIKTSKTAAELDTTGVVLKLYRAEFGTIPVEIGGNAAPLDVAAAWQENRKILTFSVVNPTHAEQTLAVKFAGAGMPASAHLYGIAGSDEKAYNEPGKPRAVTVKEILDVPFSSALRVPPLSISLYELEIKARGR
jgi:alpha-N-arabinofuranosidase